MFAFQRSPLPVATGLLVALAGASVTLAPTTSPEPQAADDAAEVAAIDTRYQRAVEANDAETMAQVLHPQFVLVLGDGRRLSRADLLRSAREREASYERQVEDPGTQAVLVVGDTAIVTARLWSKGHGPRGPFEHRLWFSDTYVRTPDGWRYLFGQASLPLR